MAAHGIRAELSGVALSHHFAVVENVRIIGDGCGESQTESGCDDLCDVSEVALSEHRFGDCPICDNCVTMAVENFDMMADLCGRRSVICILIPYLRHRLQLLGLN